MKKILYIFSIALLGATACSINEIEQLKPMDENGKVTYVMGLEFPEIFVATRGAMADNPVIDNVYVAVFGSEGYLNDYAKAVPCDASGNEKASFTDIQNGVLFYYKVTLTATTSRRTVHVIANGPEQLQFNAYDYEVMPDLTTDAGSGAYWTTFQLPHGTSDRDDNGYFIPSEEAEEAFSNLKLIRNFARVNLTSSAPDFVLEGYKIFNTPNKGRIVTWKADYQPEASANPRVDGYYTPYVGAKNANPMTFLEILNAGYIPSLATGAAIDQSEPTTSMQYTTGPQYVFEREQTNGANRPYIIVKGQFEGKASSYYRLDFTDKDGTYIPIFRNFKYDINIDHIAKNGVSDPKNAQPSNVNVSATIETASLTDLSDGESRILVQYLDKTFVTAGDTQFPYLYLRDATQAISAQSVTAAKFRILTDAELAAEGKQANTTEQAFTVSGVTDYYTDSAWHTGTGWSSADNWQEVTLNIAAVGNAEKRTTFRITGETADHDKMFRDVTIRVLAKQNFNATVRTAGSNIGSLVTVTLNLPGNLPPSIFPLEVAFEDSNKTLNPNGIDMPARVGTSIVTGKTDRSYQFVKSISYSEYTESSHQIPCVFKRIATGSTTLYMENPVYFNKPYSVSVSQN